MGKLCCIAACLFALAAAACEAAAPKGLQTASGAGLCKYAGALRFAGRYASNLAQEAERLAATAGNVKELASFAASLAAPLDGKNESVVAAVKALQGKGARTAERELRKSAEAAAKAARALTVGSGSLRSFVSALAALGTSVQAGQSFSCIDEETPISQGTIDDEKNANTIADKACAEVETARWTDANPLADETVGRAIKELAQKPQLSPDADSIGAEVTASAGEAECRLLAIAASGQAGNGGLLLKDTGAEDEKQNTVHLGTFVKITALSGGSASFDKDRNLTECMNIESALQAITNTKTAVEKHKAFACSENTCPTLEEAKKTVARTVAAIQRAAKRDKNAQDDERTPRERTETQIKARTASANAQKGTQAQAPTENAQTGYTASDASQGVPFAATLAVAAGAATTHFVPQQAARH
ncbi:hypothetical protein, conserved in T. vivax [Trypanosoma vivax Y486]|uniref:Variant surface glycoprotein (VSG) n=1 Tax=Trypanosoma vivax (strain Y486) TaxID=1055687 RepID=F9WT80_TRYVY|nr:hypothetical protein, conserved in T. vivax [Trypanosoma vivax Y486]|eukprot:CCD20773.1 hypothetical protein, conserved in T. vivax [Trypanosoma vivax Y486]